MTLSQKSPENGKRAGDKNSCCPHFAPAFKMVNTIYKHVFLCGWLMSLLILDMGCLSIARAAMFKIVDVTDKPALHGDLEIGALYKMETYLFLQDDQDIGKEPILVTPGELGVVGGMEYRGPNSRSDYNSSPATWPHVQGIVEPGTRLRLTAIRKVNSAFDAGWTYPIVTIVDGQFRGQNVNIVDLVKKCEEYSHNKVLTHCLDERLLCRVSE